MDQPLGAAVGNALEVLEALATVRGEGPPDFTELVLDACAHLLALSDLGIDSARAARAERAVADGSAEADVGRWIAAQGGTPTRPRSSGPGRPRGLGAGGGLRRAPRRDPGRHRRPPSRRRPPTKEDEIDHAVGIVCRRKRGDPVEAGEALAEVHAREAAAARRRREVLAAYALGDEPPPERRVLLEVIGLTRRPDHALTTDATSGRRGHRARRSSTTARRRRSLDASRRYLACADARAARGRDRPAALAPVLEGRRLERVEIADPRLTRPLDPRRRRGLRASASPRRPPRQVSDRSLRVGSRAARPPADDGLASGTSRAGKLSHDPLSPRGCQARRRLGRRLSRRAAVRHLAPARAGRGRAVSRRAARPGAARRAFTPRALAAKLARRRTPIKAAILDQRTRRRRREHLRRRGALARADPSAPRGRRASTRRGRALHRAIREALERGIARQGSTLSRLPAARRRPAGCRTSSRSTAGRASLRSLRHADREHPVAGRGTWYCPTCQALPTPRAARESPVAVEAQSSV